MKIVYGNPNTIMTIGMSLVGDVPTPFFGFVNRDGVKDDPFFSSGPSASALINRIDEMGGAIIYVENPEAAERFHFMLANLFSEASTTEWQNVEQTTVGVQ